eukprot:8394041-Lingulodinium_polyedra.AAC.1
MREVAEVACPPSPLTDPEVLSVLGRLSDKVFSSFGQTKVIEDSLKALRDQEVSETRNKRLELERQWLTLQN